MKKILVVDDDVELIGSMTTLLQGAGYSVISSSEGASGVELCKSEKPDLVLLDVMMKTKTEGMMIAKSLKEDPELSKIPVVLVTGIRSDMNLPFGLQADDEYLPVDDVIEKPFKPEKLLGMVRKVLSD